MRPIDADDLKGNLNELYARCGHCDGYGYYSAEKVLQTVNKQPTIEQPAWISCEERLPEESGVYLVMYAFARGNNPAFYQEVLSFALCLEDVDEYAFNGCKHSGWYVYDSEVGCCERTGIAYWMPLPELPKGVE